MGNPFDPMGMGELGKKGNILVQDYTKQLSDIAFGRTPVPQSPIYKGLQQSMNTDYTQMINAVMKEGAARGIEGGAMERMVREAMMGKNKALLAQLYPIFSAAFNQAGPIGMELLKGGQQAWENFLKAWMQKKQMESTEDIAKMGQITQGSSAGIQKMPSCCFIMLEANDLTNEVRFYRDMLFPQDSYVAKGYRRMARWLVPLMRKNKFIKWFVKTFITHPIAVRCKTGNPGLFLYCFVIVLMWEFYGRITE